MNSLQATPAAVNLMLNENWYVTVTREIDSLPDTPADFATPAYVGQLDAEDGEECRPLYWYARLGQIEEYIWGFKDTTEYLQQRDPAIEDDHDFIRTGGA